MHLVIEVVVAIIAAAACVALAVQSQIRWDESNRKAAAALYCSQRRPT